MIIKVLHAFIWFSISRGGGTCDLIYKIVKSQEKESDLKPIIYASKEHLELNLVEGLKKTIFILKDNIIKLFNLNLISPAFSELKNIRPDIIHLHVFRSLQNVFLYFYCLFTKTPYVMDAHGSVPYWDKNIFKKKLFDFLIGKKIMLGASAWIAESNVGIKEYINHFPELKSKKIDLISPPFGIDEFLDLPKNSRDDICKKYKIPKNVKIISFLGRLHKDKGIDFLIKGIAKLLEQRNDIVCLIIGPDDGYEDYLRKLSINLKIKNNIFFIGFKSGENKNELLMHSDLVVQLSRFEQGAWAPMEGLLCGTPILVTRNTGAGEDVERLDAGYLVDYGDIKEFTNQVEYIFKNKEIVMQKTNKAKDFIIKNLSMDARMHEYISIYKRCIKEV